MVRVLDSKQNPLRFAKYAKVVLQHFKNPIIHSSFCLCKIFIIQNKTNKIQWKNLQILVKKMAYSFTCRLFTLKSSFLFQFSFVPHIKTQLSKIIKHYRSVPRKSSTPRKLPFLVQCHHFIDSGPSLPLPADCCNSIVCTHLLH